MKIAHLSIRHPASDNRLFYKQAVTLQKAGYSVNLIIPHPRDEVIQGINILSLPEYKKRRDKILKNIPRTLIKSLKLNAKIYQLYDPEIIPVGLVLKLLGKKVICDFSEDYYSDTFDKKWLGILKKPAAIYISILQKIALKTFDNIIAAEPEIESKFKSDKTILLRNFPVLSIRDNPTRVSYKKNKFTLIYAGWLTRTRGIKEVIESLEFLETDVEFLLMGKWEEGYKEECEKLDGWRKTNYLGYKTLEEVFSYIKQSDIGICVLYPIPNYVLALPVKVFEYMAFSIPTIMSDFPYWKEMYSECALFVNPHDPKDIVKKVNILIKDKKLREKLGKRGGELIDAEYNWEKESKKLIKLYEDLS